MSPIRKRETYVPSCGRSSRRQSCPVGLGCLHSARGILHYAGGRKGKSARFRARCADSCAGSCNIRLRHGPANLAALSGLQGACYGAFPIVFIIIMAVWFYEVTVVSGRSEDLKSLFDIVGGGDIRIQAVLVAFCFGGLLEALGRLRCSYRHHRQP